MDENKSTQDQTPQIIDTPVSRKEFTDLKYTVNNHKHMQYDQTKSLGISSTRYIIWRVWDYATFQATGTTVAGDLECPFAGTITAIGAFEDTAGTTGTAQFDVNINGTTIMSSAKLTIDTTEKTTRTAATPAVLTTTTIAVGDILTVDIDTVQTTPAKGLTIVLTFTT